MKVGRAVLLPLLAVVLLIGAAAFTLFSETGFSRIVLPYAARRAGADLHAGRGRMEFDGTVELADLELEAGNLHIAIGRGAILLAPRALAAGRADAIESVEVDGATIEVRGGSENLRTLSRPLARDEPPTLADLRLPFAVPRASIRDATIRLIGALGEERLVARVAKLTAADFAPGKSGSLAIEGTLAGDGRSGGVDVTATVGHGANGEVLGWRGSGRARLAAPDGEPFEAFLATDAFRRQGAVMDASLTLDGRVGPRRVGRMRATWHEQFPEAGKPRAVNVAIELSEVQPEVLNPLVALLGGGRVEGAKLDADGRFGFGADGSTLDVDADGSVAGGSIRAELRHAVSAERASGNLDLDARAVDLSRLARIVDPRNPHDLAGSLDLKARLGADGAAVADLVPAARGTIDAHVEKARVANLRLFEFLARHTGVGELREFKYGTIDAPFTLADGVLQTERTELKSPTARFFVHGTLRTSRQIDGLVEIRLGPELLRKMKNVPLAGKVAAAADELLELPFAVRVTGRYPEPRYTIAPHAPSMVGGASGQVTGAIEKGRRGVEEAKEFVGNLLDKAKPRR